MWGVGLSSGQIPSAKALTTGRLFPPGLVARSSPGLQVSCWSHLRGGVEALVFRVCTYRMEMLVSLTAEAEESGWPTCTVLDEL